MTPAVLIIFSWFSGYVNGNQVTHIEFSTIKNCTVAKEALLREWNSTNSRIQAFCVEK